MNTQATLLPDNLANANNPQEAAHQAKVLLSDAELIGSLTLSESKFLDSFEYALQKDQIQLPILPEIAIRVRQMAGSPDCDAMKLARVIQTDQVLSSRLLQVSNSPAFYTGSKITSPQYAITKLGLSTTSQIVTTLSLEGLYRARSMRKLKNRLMAMWKHNCRVASISYVIAKKFTSLSPEQAMMSGLLHDIGKLPILLYCHTNPHLAPTMEDVDQLLAKLHSYIGGFLLNHWELPAEIIAVAKEHEILDRHSGEKPDYVDVVTIANLYSYLGAKGNHKRVDWKDVAAFKKLGLTPAESIEALNEAKSELQEIEKILR